MDAHALLSSQGWRGKGHSLHATDDSIGLAKPLLLNRKDNTKGLGQRPHFTSDQWWMNAFDEQLKGLDTSSDGKVVQTVTTGRLNTIDKGAGKYMLYASFVRGGLLEGTITGLESADTSKSPSPEEQESENTNAEKKRKESKGERRARRAARRLRKAEKKARQYVNDSAASKQKDKSKETKEERRARKEATRERRIQSEQQSRESG